MTATAGRRVQLLFGGNSPEDDIAGVREKGLELNGEAIDITSGEDDGWRTLLEDASQYEVNISLSGVTKSTRLLDCWASGDTTQSVQVIYPNGKRISGTFMLVSYKETANYKEAVTFEASLQNSGVVTFS